jgi:hypothetical protein
MSSPPPRRVAQGPPCGRIRRPPRSSRDASPARSTAVSPAGVPRPTIATQSPPSRTSDVKLAATLGSVVDSPLAAVPMRRQFTPSLSSTSTTTAIARGPDEGRSPNDATSTRTAVPLESIAPDPSPQPTQSSLDAAIRSLCAHHGKFPLVPLPSLRFRRRTPFPATADAASRRCVGRHTRLSAPAHMPLGVPLRLVRGRRSPQLGAASTLRLRLGLQRS